MPYLLIAYLTDCKLLPDLGLLRTLTGLTMLYIARFKLLSDLGPLANLIGLTSLSVDECELVSDLGPLAKLTGLTSLSISVDQESRILSASLGEDRATVTLATSPLSAGITYALRPRK